MSTTVSFARCELVLPDGWVDITDDLPTNTPPTLARTDGLGALQFSVARYRGGKQPGVSTDDLETMLRELAAKDRLGSPKELTKRTDGMYSLSADFSRGNDFYRIWYLSDGDSVAMVSYTTQAADAVRESGELAEADAIVSSIEFPNDSNKQL